MERESNKKKNHHEKIQTHNTSKTSLLFFLLVIPIIFHKWRVRLGYCISSFFLFPLSQFIHTHTDTGTTTMIYWPKLLITAYAITNTLEPFIPLYLINQLQLNALQVSAVVAMISLLRLFSGIYTALVDNRPHLYGPVIAILVTFSSVSFMILLSLSNPSYGISDSWIWTLVIICTLLNGLFYQPLGSLIDSAIIKTLGDFRVLFYGMCIIIFYLSPLLILYILIYFV